MSRSLEKSYQRNLLPHICKQLQIQKMSQNKKTIDYFLKTFWPFVTSGTTWHGLFNKQISWALFS